VLKIWNFSL